MIINENYNRFTLKHYNIQSEPVVYFVATMHYQIPLYAPRLSFVVLIVIVFNVVAFVYVSYDGNRNVYFIKQSSAEVTVAGDDVPGHAACIRIEKLDPDTVPRNRSIFFIETNRRDVVELTPRQACSVESAARVNPDKQVYVLFLSPKFQCQNDITAMFSLISNYHNVYFRHIDLFTYIHDTPIEDFVRSGIMENGKWLVEQHSDMLRILTLWKFGGIYMDLDVISLKPMPLINFIGAEYPGDLLASCVIGMQNKNIAERAIRMFIEGWDGENWIQNGPFLLTNLMKEQCRTNDVLSMYSSNSSCNNFTIYPPETFGPIAWYEWQIFFNSSETEFVIEKISNSLAVHFWNKITKEQLITSSSHQPYAYIANNNCPKVFNTVINHF